MIKQTKKQRGIIVGD